MGRSAGVYPNCSLNNGKNSRGKQLDGQAKSLTQWLVSEFWACHPIGAYSPRIGAKR